MEVLVRNAEGNVTQRDREYAAKKLGRLDRYFSQAQKVEMVHRKEKHGHRIEITVFADGLTVRGEEHDLTVRAAIDRVTDKLETRLRRLKGRLLHNHRKRGATPPSALQEIHADEEEADLLPLAERKQFDPKPMSIEEAALQMEMVDHPFFVFTNSETRRTEVIYKRRDGKYGLLEPM
ncbi:MAG: ribosomal subunit interface protein [Chthonomonas sp.]|nr:ribosome-associated translation inhibitor RaiA [Fimbriimonadaceae bacterium]